MPASIPTSKGSFFSSEALRSKLNCFLSNYVLSRGKKTALASLWNHLLSFYILHVRQDSWGCCGIAFLPLLVSTTERLALRCYLSHIASCPWCCQKQVWKEGCSDLLYKLHYFCYSLRKCQVSTLYILSTGGTLLPSITTSQMLTQCLSISVLDICRIELTASIINTKFKLTAAKLHWLTV